MLRLIKEHYRNKALKEAMAVRKAKNLNNPVFLNLGNVKSIGFICCAETVDEIDEVNQITEEISKTGIKFSGLLVEGATLFKDDPLREEFVQQCRMMIEFLKYTKSMTILSLDNCFVADKQNFIDAVKNWVPDGFESDKPEDGVFLKIKRGTIHEVAVVNSSMDECSIMITKGELTPEFIKNVEQSMKSVFSTVE